MAGQETSISLGDIQARAEKLEAEKPAETTTPAANTEETTPETTQTTPVDEKKPAEIKPEEKKAPNDPDELRKWNTKVSMELSDVKKQLQILAETLNKTSKKPVDWKELAKSPEKLQAAIEAQQKEQATELQSKYSEEITRRDAEIVASEKERRLHDPKYPRWGELLPTMVNMAVNMDREVDFNKAPKTVLDQMYEVACARVAPGAAKPAAAAVPQGKTFTEADIAAAREEARKEALAEAQKGLSNEMKGAGVAGMGKGATKGASSDVKDVAKKMPLQDLKQALQQASDK